MEGSGLEKRSSSVIIKVIPNGLSEEVGSIDGKEDGWLVGHIETDGTIEGRKLGRSVIEGLYDG